MKRHNSRIIAMMTLYQNDLIAHSKEQELLQDDLIKSSEIFHNLEELEIDENFYNVLVNGVKKHKEEIDQLIASNLVKWPIDRLSFVDRAILEIATFEMLYTKTPKNVIIDEAVSISTDYSDIEGFESRKFNNKVLDNIKGSIDGRN